MNKYLKLGPGIMVTAAFIGPGTVTVCLLAGNLYIFTLLWALVFASFSTIVLQEMSARLGLVTGSGLSEALRNMIASKWVKFFSFGLIVTGILLGNTAYEAGNISGTHIGIKMVFGSLSGSDFLINIYIYISVACLLYFGTYKILETFFIIIVALMSISFITASVITAPDLLSLIKGLVMPSFPKGSIITIVGLIGTTVVPYNLFLHAALIKNKWTDVSKLKEVRKDTVIAILLGGLISLSIVITGAISNGTKIDSITELSYSLIAIFGNWGRYLFGFGIFAAGFTSSITAPLAAALVAKGLFGWEDDIKSFKYRLVWASILTAGFLFSSLGYKPIEIIALAQFANGILLPFIAGFLLWVVNQNKLMGKYVNTTWQNMAGFSVILISILLGLKGVITLF